MNILKNNKILKNYNFLFSKLNTGHSSLIENLCKNGNPIINSSVVVRKILSKVGFISEHEPSFTNDYHTWLKISLITNKFILKKRLGNYLL